MDLTIVQGDITVLEIDDFEVSINLDVITPPELTVNAVTQEVVEVMAGLKGDTGAAGASDWSQVANKPVTLTAIGGLVISTDQIAYSTSSTTWATTSLTTFGRSLIDDTSASAARTTLGLGTIATAAAPTGTVVGTTDTQTLTNKTLTSPIIGTIVNTGTLTLPTTTDTLVGRATTDTLTNKTISGASNTLSNISTASITALQEAVEDYVGAMFSNGTHSGVTVSYNDTPGTIDITTTTSALPTVRFSASVADTGVTGDDRAYVARTITEAHLRVSAAPVGSALTVVVQYSSDRTTWNTATTLTIADGASVLTHSVTGLSIAQSVGHYIRLNVTAVGSTTAALDPVVDVVVV